MCGQKWVPAVPTPLNQQNGSGASEDGVARPSLHALLKNGDGGSVQQHYPQICRLRRIVEALC